MITIKIKRLFIISLLLAGLTICFSSSAQALWLSGYEYRKAITINHTKIDSALTDFPVAVILSDTTNIVDGNDVKFTLADGSTKLDYEKEKYAADDAAYWVNIPSVSSGTDTTFYMYYGKTGDSDESTSAIWDSNYKMVQHLEETSGTHYDSTSYNNNGTPYGGVTQNATGQIDGADYFDGSNDYLQVADSSSLDITSAITVEAWVKKNVDGTRMAMVSKWNDAGGNQRSYLFQMGPTGTIAFSISSGGDAGTIDTLYSNSDVTGTDWHHIVAIYNPTEKAIYIDGEEDNSETSGETSIYSGSSKLQIGTTRQVGNNYYYLNGIVDEVRISAVARDSAWIKASYNSGNDSLLTFGNEQSEGVIPEPSSLLLLGFGVAGIAVFRRKPGR